MVSRRRIGVVLAVLVLSGVVWYLTAPQRAKNAEESYVSNRLESASCLDHWGANEGAATGGTTITDVGLLIVDVTVNLPYAYRIEENGETVHADAVSEAEYEVTLFGTRRVGGDEISPC